MLYHLRGVASLNHPFIAKRFQTRKKGLALDTEVLSQYSDVIDLSIGDPDFTTDPKIIQAAMADALAGHTHYGNPKGDPELIDAICYAWQEDYAQHITADEVLVTTGSCMGMYLALTAILDPGDEVIVFSPYFAVYRQQVEQCGGVCVEVPTYAEESFVIDKTRLKAAVTPKTKAIIINNPCNPTGVAYSKETCEAIAETAEQFDLLVLADEIYASFLLDGTFLPLRKLPGMDKRTITLHSFSKNYLMTGWRIGYLVAEPELIEVINFVNGGVVYSAPSVSQRAALAAIKRRRELGEPCAKPYLERLQYASDRAARIPYLDLVKPQGTFYLFPGIQRTGLTSAQFREALLKQAHILVTPGHIFGSTGAGHFRIACTVSMETLKEAFDRMELLAI